MHLCEVGGLHTYVQYTPYTHADTILTYIPTYKSADSLTTFAYYMLPVPRVVKTLKDLCPAALFMVDSNGDLPLNIAIQRGSREVSDALLQWTFDELTKQDDNVSNEL